MKNADVRPCFIVQWVILGVLGHGKDMAILPGIRKPAAVLHLHLHLQLYGLPHCRYGKSQGTGQGNMERVYGYFGITDITAIATITTQFRDVFSTLLPKNHLNQHMAVFFNETSPRPIQHTICDVRLFVCVSVYLYNRQKIHFQVDWRLLVEGPIANIDLSRMPEPLLHSPWMACSHYYVINITLQHFFFI